MGSPLSPVCTVTRRTPSAPPATRTLTHVLRPSHFNPRPQVDPNRAPCVLRSSYACQRCPRSFQARTPLVSTAPIANDGNVLLPLLFKEPVQLSAIYIKQIRKPSLIKVGLPIVQQPAGTAPAQRGLPRCIYL